MAIPQSVIHINFGSGELIFDPRPVWTALRKASSNGKISTTAQSDVIANFSNTALSIATRYTLMKVAVRELKTALQKLYALCPDSTQTMRPMIGNEVEQARDQVLVYTDSVLFEFRSYLELIATFTYGILKGIGQAPSSKQVLSSGKTVMLANKKHELITHNFLLYLFDQLRLSIDWYKFLQRDRNHFTHEAAPYCAIEVVAVQGSFEFDTIIMRKNIVDFATSDPEDYFRVSELQNIVEGVLGLSAAVESYLVAEVLR